MALQGIFKGVEKHSDSNQPDTGCHMTSISFGFPSSNEDGMARQAVTILKDRQNLNGATETAQPAQTLASKHDDQNSTSGLVHTPVHILMDIHTQ